MNELVEFSVGDERSSRKISVVTSCEEDEPVSEDLGVWGFLGFFLKMFEELFWKCSSQNKSQ